MPIDEDHVLRAVDELKRLGFPPTEGYFLVVLTEAEAADLSAHLRTKYGSRLVYDQRYAHPPLALEVTMRELGLRPAFTLGSAFVCYRPEQGVTRIF